MSLVLSAAACAVAVLTLLYVRHYLKTHSSRDYILGELGQEVQSLVNRVNQITDDDARLITERMKKLRGMLDEADKRINVYSRELVARNAAARNLTAFHAAKSEKVEIPLMKPVAVSPPPDDDEKTGMRNEQQNGQNQTQSEKSFREKAANLALLGFSSREIAEKLKKTPEEIEFALFMVKEEGEHGG